MESLESVRVDRWLWATRLYRTRSAASDACRGGQVRIDGRRAKPATPVRVGARVEARVADRERIVVVTRLLDRRVGAPVAQDCYVDHSPPPPERLAAPPVFVRDRGAGRPTKRDRRALDRLRGRRPRDR